MKAITEKIHAQLRKPWFAVLTTVLLAVAGLLGSVYSKQIAWAFPLILISNHPQYVIPIFWVIFGLAAILFWTQRRSVDKGRTEAEQKVVERSKDLEDLFRTLPPRNFLEWFGTTYRRCDELTWNVLGQGQPIRDEVIAAIQQVLHHFCLLAHFFDEKAESSGTKYAANIMVFAYSSTIPEPARTTIEKSLQFVPSETALDRLNGVLFLRADLSSTSNGLDDSGNVLHDRELVPLALGIPETIRTVDRKTGRNLWRVMPGAPMAFSRKETQIASDTSELVEWCDNEGDFTEEVKRQLLDYFGSTVTPSIGSFISSHLVRGEGVDEDPEEVPIGVLNIHSPERGLLRGREEAIRLFVALSRPLRLLLFRLLETLQEIEFKEKEFWWVEPKATSEQ